jgi:hypothetical protein
LVEIYLPNCISVSSNAFKQCDLGGGVNLDKCVNLGDYAFNHSPNLKSIDLPMCSKIGARAFEQCVNLERIEAPRCVSLSGGVAFAQCYKLSYVNMKLVNYLGYFDFNSDSSLTSIDFPNVSQISNVFQNCSRLANVSLPALWSLTEGTSLNCSSLSEIFLPMADYFYGSIFQNCSLLRKIDVPMMRTFTGGSTFNSCTNLSSLYLFGKSIVTLGNVNAFSKTPMSNSTYLGYYGSIFVHPDLVSSYKTATNWAAYSNRIVSIPSEMLNAGIWNCEFMNSTLTEVPVEKQNASLIGAYAFSECANLTSVSLSMCEYIGAGAFSRCSSLSMANFPTCKVIGRTAFLSCGLEQFDAQNCKTIGQNAFSACVSLVSVNLLSCEFIENGAFFGCPKLTSIDLPMCSVIHSNAFYNCYSLASISLNNIVYIGSGTFGNCTALESVYLLGSSIATMEGMGIFQNTPLYSSGYLGHFGSIYVRASLLEEWKSALSYYSSRFVGLTDEQIAALNL